MEFTITLYHFRIQEVKKISKRYKKDIKLLVERLDKHGDSFRTASVETDIKPEHVNSAKSNKTHSQGARLEKPNSTGGKKPASKRKSKGDKVIKILLLYYIVQ